MPSQAAQVLTHASACICTEQGISCLFELGSPVELSTSMMGGACCLHQVNVPPSRMQTG